MKHPNVKKIVTALLGGTLTVWILTVIYLVLRGWASLWATFVW